MSTDPQAVLGWLREGGYPLEFETARQLRGAGLAVEQGRHCTDPITQKSREVDVVARLMDPMSHGVRVYQVAECKGGATSTSSLSGRGYESSQAWRLSPRNDGRR